MLRLAILFFVIALVAALVGFGNVAGFAWESGKIFAFIFLVLAVLSMFMGYRGRPVDTI